MTLEYRRLDLDDLEALVSLDASCFASPWSKTQLSEELSHPEALVIGAFDSTRLIGTVCARLMVDEMWIFRIMTLPAFRRKKIAHTLVQRVEALSKTCDLWLEVSLANKSAVAFYEREGFVAVNTRKDYYPEGDALVMKRDARPQRLDYELLDFGDGYKLERFGQHVLKRPDAAAIGMSRQTLSSWTFDSACERRGKGFEWSSALEPWVITRGPMSLELRLSQSKNVGVFPEQQGNWEWLAQTLERYNQPQKVLNLFAYTGAASIVCAQNGAQVCHVDSARSAVKWASENALRSGGESNSIRWIVDDAQRFLEKEIRRGHTYDGIILDPPPMGHGQGNRFEFRKDALDLIAACQKVLTPQPAFFLLNAYAMNLEPEALGRLVGPQMGLPLEVGELAIKEASGNRRLSCSVYARYRR